MRITSILSSAMSTKCIELNTAKSQFPQLFSSVICKLIEYRTVCFSYISALSRKTTNGEEIKNLMRLSPAVLKLSLLLIDFSFSFISFIFFLCYLFICCYLRFHHYYTCNKFCNIFHKVRPLYVRKQ